jgi:integrase
MSEMAIVNLPYLQILTDRHGHVRCYFRRRGYERVTLPNPSAAGFLDAYYAAHGGEPLKGGAGRERTEPGTISALIVAYYQSTAWSTLRESTKTGYRNMLDRFRAKHGHRSVKRITTPDLNALFEDVARTTPGAARNLRKRLRTVFRLAVKMGWRATNPVVESEPPPHRVKGFTPWSDDDCSAYEARWPSGTRERLAYALLLYTGQRRSDVVTMGRQHVRGGRAHVVQQKTGRRLAIRIHASLQRELDALSPGQMTFVVTQFGQPFSAAGFTAWFRERAAMAGLHARTPHGLRKAAGRRLAEAGCSTKQIMAVLGVSIAVAEVYTNSADQTKLADDAMARLANARM